MTPKQLKRLRHRLRFSQQALGVIVGVSKTSIYMWESGRTPMPHWLQFAVETLKGRDKLK